ncbi:MAG: DUF255 domain-containing protein [Isosphaeraceae bacterium]|nr:DUF255 domain-containing protein [Isosphaeraceae bacterium]
MRRIQESGPRSSRVALATLVGIALAAAGARADEPRAAEGPRRTNRLAKETSPYLLLHAHNPVEWYPWGPEAFAKAKAEKKPIFLSIGYSSCYWCHVMERESFMDADIAKKLNEEFVCIKVDREERPDVDHVYMVALQAFSGSGGWPMSMFLTPDGRPFFGGTYFPPRDREGILGFSSLLAAVSDAWKNKRDLLERDATNLADVVRKAVAGGSMRKLPLTRELAAGARTALAEQFDPQFAGFGFDPARPKRPKFPEPANLVYLLDQHRRLARDPARKTEAVEMLGMALETLDRMQRGGIRDHLAGGYHRYSTTRDWSIPHFEKMLYDNAQLAEVHLTAYEITKDPRWKVEAEATLAFVLRSMTSSRGSFDSALDAESEAEEGRTYVWSKEELEKTLGPDFGLFSKIYGIDAAPNFEHGRFVLLEPKTRAEQSAALGLSADAIESRLVPARAKLLALRDQRPAPLRDDKTLTSWNGLMIGAFAEAHRVLGRPSDRQAAERAVEFIARELTTPEGRLLRTYRAGVAKLPAYLEDYAFLADGLLRLHAATRDEKHLTHARTVVDRMLKDFSDHQEGGFFFTADDHESLLARPKDPFDNAIPGANSLAIRSLVRLGVATGERAYLDHARRALEAFSSSMSSNPAGAPIMLTALEEYLDAVAGGETPQPKSMSVLGGLTNLKPPAPGGVVKASLEPSTAKLSVGATATLKLRISIAPRFHIYANPTGSETVDPTTVDLEPGSPFEVVKVDYPAGKAMTLASLGPEKLNLYEETVEVGVVLRAKPGTQPGRFECKLRLRYQACDDRSCLAPATLKPAFAVEVE